MRLPALLPLLLVAGPAHARDGWTYPLLVGAYGGAFDGLGTRPESGGLGIVDARVLPELQSGGWTLQIPIALGHLQRFGTELNETHAAGGLEVENRVSNRWRLGVLGNVDYTYKQGWPDRYQRRADGYMRPTDRFTHLDWDVGAFAVASPAPHNFLRLTYVFSSADYTEDPNYDPLDDPMHITPKDHTMHHLDVSWRRLSDAWNLAVDLEFRRKEYADVLARDAVTGNTSGNPLQIYNQYEPGVEVKLKKLGRRLDLSLRYGYEIQDDVWQGYYSYGGHNPRLLADFAITDRVSAEVKLEAWWRQYGPDSKRPSELEDGNQRWDHRGEARGRLRWAFSGGLSAFAEVDYYVRETNYPDYVPGVNPPPPRDEYEYYDIAFDYTNLDVFAGIEYRR
jgi:hypothetical protein